MIKVGITGGIGVGKSFVAKIFESMGVSIYNADNRAKFLMNYDEKLIGQIKLLFGEDIYANENKLKRKKLAQIVFSDKEKLEQLNAIVHPAVYKDGIKWQKFQEKKFNKYSLKESALLFETGSYKELDKIITVSAPLELRISRTMLRDRCNRHAVTNRIDKQISQEQKEKMADYIIYNDEGNPLLPQIWKINEAILKLKKVDF